MAVAAGGKVGLLPIEGWLPKAPAAAPAGRVGRLQPVGVRLFPGREAAAFGGDVAASGWRRPPMPDGARGSIGARESTLGGVLLLEESSYKCRNVRAPECVRDREANARRQGPPPPR